MMEATLSILPTNVLLEFELALRARGISSRTVTIYREAVERAGGPTIGSHEIRWFLASLSPSYASNQYRALQQFFKFCAEEYDYENPMTRVRPPRSHAKPVPVLDEGSLARLLESLPASIYGARDRALILMLWSTGCRRAEIANLRLVDLDLKNLTAFVTGKGGKPRVVRYDARTALAVTRYLRMRKTPSPWLWEGKKGHLHPDAVNTILKRRGKAAGVKVHPHMFRHTFAHRYLLNGGQEGDLRQLAGWQDRSMLDRYGASVAAERARDHYDGVMSR